MITCAGPLIWFPTVTWEEENENHPEGAILFCVRCGYIVCSPGPNDSVHSYTPIIMEGPDAARYYQRP